MTKLLDILYPLNIKQINIHNFDHSLVNKKYEGGLTYINDFIIHNRPIAVYKVANPNLEKGHKEFFLIENFGFGKGGQVMGMTKEELKKYSKVQALHCLKCNTIIYSCSNHHVCYCNCGESFVDGGQLYFRYSFSDRKYSKQITLDLLENY